MSPRRKAGRTRKRPPGGTPTTAPDDLAAELLAMLRRGLALATCPATRALMRGFLKAGVYRPPTIPTPAAGRDRREVA